MGSCTNQILGEQCSQEGLQIRVNPRKCAYQLEVEENLASSSRANDKSTTATENASTIIKAQSNRGGEMNAMRVHIHKKQCDHLTLKLNKARASLREDAQGTAMEEFSGAASKAENLVEECSREDWLLKALELCSEHFVEVLLALQWSSDVTHLIAPEVQLKDIIQKQVDLLNSLRGQNVEGEILASRKDDENDLITMVGQVVKYTKDVRERQLAKLLVSKHKSSATWHPPELENLVRNFWFPILGRKVFTLEGEGGSGVVIPFEWVYGKTFALKMPHPGRNDMSFRREADILGKYRNPYIVGMLGYWELAIRQHWCWWRNEISIASLLMEYLGYNLEQLIGKAKEEGKRRFSSLEVVNLMLPVAKAMQYLHDANVAHRDLKPQNIMCVLEHTDSIGCSEEIKAVKVIDFGSAWEKENVQNCPIIECHVTGTCGYMAPELHNLEEDKSVNLLKTDVFSFGMILGELLTWISPVDAFGCGISKYEFKKKVESGDRPSLPDDCPSYFKFIVESCWSGDPIIRPQFEVICWMLQIAKLLLSGIMKFNDDENSMFAYLDDLGVEHKP